MGRIVALKKQRDIAAAPTMGFNGATTMEVAGQTGQAALFGLALWLKCALAGAGVGAAIAAIQIFPGRWHPAWAVKLAAWFSCPLFAGVACGVLLALLNVPARSGAKPLWLTLCLVIGGFTAVLGAGAVAYVSRSYDPKAASKAKRVSRRSSLQQASRFADWEDRLRRIFRVAPVDPATADRNGKEGSHRRRRPSVTPGQKAKLPPERFPAGPAITKPPHYAGNPREKEIRDNQAKFDEPIR